jgi:hypothetical protein
MPSLSLSISMLLFFQVIILISGTSLTGISSEETKPLLGHPDIAPEHNTSGLSGVYVFVIASGCRGSIVGRH